MTSYTCKYCNIAFRKEKTLTSHMCPKKRRWADKGTIGTRLGFRVFQRLYELTTKAKKPKTLEEFINSNYYTAFVKFGRYLVELNPINAEDFINFVITNGVKLRDWQAQYVYDAYLTELISKEPIEKAIERSVVTMQKWAVENDEEYNDFFKLVNANEAVYLIRAGRISPWLVYLSSANDDFFGRLNDEQGKIIEEVVNPSKWQVIFMTKVDDVAFVKKVLKEAAI